MNTINPGRLKEARAGKGRGKGWSRQQLSKRSKVSARQIARIEASETDVAVRETTADRLAKALQVSVQALSGDEPLALGQQAESLGRGQRSSSPEVQIGCKIDPHVLLAYDLVKRRYGPTYTDVIYLAPLLFVLLAEGSLAWRRQLSKEIKESFDRLSSKSYKHKHLFFARAGVLRDNVVGAAIGEEESIEQADLRGNMIRDDLDMSFDFWDEPYEANPFVDYLAKLSKDLEIDDLEINHISVADYWLLRGVDDPSAWKTDYSLCGKDLKEITGNSWKAEWALRKGDVRLSDIPENLMMEERKDERVKWLEDKYKIESSSGQSWLSSTMQKQLWPEAINAVLTKEKSSDRAEKLSVEKLKEWMRDERALKEYFRLLKDLEISNSIRNSESDAKNQ